MHSLRRFLFVALGIQFLAVGLSASVFGHPVILDGDPGDWLVRSPANPNLGIIARDLSERGEYVWLDSSGDERTDFSAPDPNVDLEEFRVTSSPEGLYFLARFADVTLPAGDGAVQIQVAIDVDQLPGAGQNWLAGFTDTQVSSLALWEYLLMSRFGSGLPPSVFDQAFNDVATPGSANALVSTTSDCAELFVSWDVIGGAPTAPLRFTVAVFRSDGADTAWDIFDSSDALDCVTNYADPGLLGNTFDEVADSTIDYYFDLWLHLDNDVEPITPVVITELLYDAIGAEPAEEWIELHNLTGENLSLSDFRIGDAENPDSSEGMMAFPAGATMAPGQTIVVANNASVFSSLYSADADYEQVETDPLVPSLIRPTLWAPNFLNLGNSGDQLLLVDAQWTILEVVTWENGIYPGIVSALGSIGGQSLRRLNVVDTDNCANDFEVAPLPDPGHFETPSLVLPGPTGFETMLKQNHPNPFNPQTMIAFDLPNEQTVSLRVHDISGRLVRVLVDGEVYGQGRNEAMWNGRDDDGKQVAAGVYFYRLDAGEFSETKRMALVK